MQKMDCSNCLYGMDDVSMQNYCNEAEWDEDICDGWIQSPVVDVFDLSRLLDSVVMLIKDTHPAKFQSINARNKEIIEEYKLIQ